MRRAQFEYLNAEKDRADLTIDSIINQGKMLQNQAKRSEELLELEKRRELREEAKARREEAMEERLVEKHKMEMEVLEAKLRYYRSKIEK